MADGAGAVAPNGTVLGAGVKVFDGACTAFRVKKELFSMKGSAAVEAYFVSQQAQCVAPAALRTLQAGHFQSFPRTACGRSGRVAVLEAAACTAASEPWAMVRSEAAACSPEPWAVSTGCVASGFSEHRKSE